MAVSKEPCGSSSVMMPNDAGSAVDVAGTTGARRACANRDGCLERDVYVVWGSGVASCAQWGESDPHLLAAA